MQGLLIFVTILFCVLGLIIPSILADFCLFFAKSWHHVRVERFFSSPHNGLFRYQKYFLKPSVFRLFSAAAAKEHHHPQQKTKEIDHRGQQRRQIRLRRGVQHFVGIFQFVLIQNAFRNQHFFGAAACV